MSNMIQELTLNTYEELEKIIAAFKKGSFDLLIIMSEGGLGKSYNAEKILGNKAAKISCHATGLGLYEKAYEQRKKKLFWFDDVENMFNDNKAIGLLKQYCEIRPVKEIQYLTSWNMEKTRSLPKSYKIEAKVMITANMLPRQKNVTVQALLDRGIVVRFMPSIPEREKYIKKNFKDYDKEIISFLKTRNAFSLRDYLKAIQLKNAGFDWKKLQYFPD